MRRRTTTTLSATWRPTVAIRRFKSSGRARTLFCPSFLASPLRPPLGREKTGNDEPSPLNNRDPMEVEALCHQSLQASHRFKSDSGGCLVDGRLLWSPIFKALERYRIRFDFPSKHDSQAGILMLQILEKDWMAIDDANATTSGQTTYEKKIQQRQEGEEEEEVTLPRSGTIVGESHSEWARVMLDSKKPKWGTVEPPSTVVFESVYQVDKRQVQGELAGYPHILVAGENVSLMPEGGEWGASQWAKRATDLMRSLSGGVSTLLGIGDVGRQRKRLGGSSNSNQGSEPVETSTENFPRYSVDESLSYPEASGEKRPMSQSTTLPPADDTLTMPCFPPTPWNALPRSSTGGGGTNAESSTASADLAAFERDVTKLLVVKPWIDTTLATDGSGSTRATAVVNKRRGTSGAGDANGGDYGAEPLKQQLIPDDLSRIPYGNGPSGRETLRNRIFFDICEVDIKTQSRRVIIAGLPFSAYCLLVMDATTMFLHSTSTTPEIPNFAYIPSDQIAEIDAAYRRLSYLAGVEESGAPVPWGMYLAMKCITR